MSTVQPNSLFRNLLYLTSPPRRTPANFSTHMVPYIFGGVPAGPDHHCWGQFEQVPRYLKLFGREIIFEVMQRV